MIDCAAKSLILDHNGSIYVKTNVCFASAKDCNYKILIEFRLHWNRLYSFNVVLGYFDAYIKTLYI
jgi:hypothetical protein